MVSGIEGLHCMHVRSDEGVSIEIIHAGGSDCVSSLSRRETSLQGDEQLPLVYE